LKNVRRKHNGNASGHWDEDIFGQDPKSMGRGSEKIKIDKWINIKLKGF
jgi:hypothetical protein